MKSLAKVLFVVALVGAVTGCYLPVRFDAEITLDRAGYYTMIFDGYLADVQLYKDLKDGKVSPAEEREKVQLIKTDLTRDSSTKEFQYYNKGISKVHWEKSGDLLRTKMVTFFQRNENMLSMSYVRSKREITLRGTYLRQDQQQQIEQIGLNVQGEIRVITEARVVSHNATEVKERDGKPMYVWKIQNVRSPSPKMVIIPG